jgi:hypothetical protein
MITASDLIAEIQLIATEEPALKQRVRTHNLVCQLDSLVASGLLALGVDAKTIASVTFDKGTFRECVELLASELSMKDTTPAQMNWLANAYMHDRKRKTWAEAVRAADAAVIEREDLMTSDEEELSEEDYWAECELLRGSAVVEECAIQERYRKEMARAFAGETSWEDLYYWSTNVVVAYVDEATKAFLDWKC